MNPANVGGLLLIDTEVLIDDLREQPLAASAITIAELDVGVRDGVERQRLDAFVEAFEVVPLDRQATARA
jgi:predicted nucleic acid-binding protein